MVPFNVHLLGWGCNNGWIVDSAPPPPPSYMVHPPAPQEFAKLPHSLCHESALSFSQSPVFDLFSPNLRHVLLINQHVDGGHFQAYLLGPEPQPPLDPCTN